MVANRLPKKKGNHLAHALTPPGGVESEFTITREDEDRFIWSVPERRSVTDLDLLLKNLPKDNSVKLVNKTMDLGTWSCAVRSQETSWQSH